MKKEDSREREIMEKLVFKNMYLNIVAGGLLVLLAVLGLALGWIKDFLPIIIGIILILLSIKRFVYSFKKITSKNATLILVVELILDFIFAALLMYLKDYVEIFIGLIIYIRGVAYLLINYIATRKINIVQYLFNIFYVTLGAFLMFYPLNGSTTLVVGAGVLLLLVGAIYLQAGVKEVVKKEEKEDLIKKKEKEQQKEMKQEDKHEKKIDNLEKKVKEVEEENKKSVAETKQLQKEIIKTKEAIKPKPAVVTEVKPEVKKVKPVVDYESKTLVELKVLAKQKNLQGFSQLNKAQLIAKFKETK